MVADAAVVVVVALHALPVFAIDLRHTFLPRDLLYLEPISYLFALATMTSLLVHVLAMTVRVVVSTVLSHVGIASVSLHVALFFLKRIDSVPVHVFLLLSQRSLCLKDLHLLNDFGASRTQ